MLMSILKRCKEFIAKNITLARVRIWTSLSVMSYWPLKHVMHNRDIILSQ